MPRPFTHDLYAPLAYVEALGPGDGQTMPGGAGTSTWLDYDDARRLTAYRILAAKRDNVARFYLPEAMWQKSGAATGTELERVRQMLAAADAVAPAEKYREYGDPALLVAQGRSLMLGDSQDLVLPDLVELQNAAADDDGAPAEGDEAEAHAAAVADRKTDQQRLETFQAWLDAWADDEKLPLRLLEGEENSVGDGDGVYVLGWSERLGRPRLRVYDPGWYFPDLSSIGDDEEFPTVVHVAWEEDRNGKIILHRKTWRVLTVGDDDPLAPPAPYSVPWSDAPVDRVCVYSVAEWDIAHLKTGDSIYNLAVDDSRATVLKEPTALGVDFLPVVHVPNDAAGTRHFGRALPLLVAQLLDDVAATDTDLQANSELVGSTPMVTTGAGAFSPEAGPGAVYGLPAGADAKLLDTSRALTGLTGYANHLLDRLSVNSRLAGSLLGRVKPNEVPSGYALELGFAPTRSLVREMRMVRAEKYPLILKFAMRLAQVNGTGPAALPKGPTPRAEIALGGFLPADKAAAMTQVSEGIKSHAISRLTGVQILMSAGFPIEDAEAEVDRIKAELFADAVALVDATGDVGAAYDLLGIPRPAALPPVQLPPEPPAGGAGAGGA